MAAFNKFQPFVEHLCEGVHNFASHTVKVMLTNGAPTSSMATKSELTDIAAGNGYTAGGNTASLTTSSQTGGTYKLVLADPATWTASGGSIGPFRYAVLYNDTPSSPADPLVGWWDYGSPITLAIGETFTVDFDPSSGVFTLA